MKPSKILIILLFVLDQSKARNRNILSKLKANFRAEEQKVHPQVGDALSDYCTATGPLILTRLKQSPPNV